MLDKLRPALIVTSREIKDQLRDWRIIFPVVVLTIFFPGLMNYTAGRVVNFVEQYGANLIAERFIPFLLMIVGFFPITVSLVIALESFSGETERRSIEPLLSSPLSDWQLYLGKLLASLIGPLAASYLGIAVYLQGMYRNALWRPELSFLLLIVCLTAVQALVMVSGAVVVSTQTTSVRAANLLSSFIIVPMALLLQGESVVMLYADYDVLWWAVIGQAVLASLLIRMGIAHFNREELLGRELDTLNFRWMWRVFWRAFLGQARTIGEWFSKELPQTLRRLRMPMGLMTLMIVAGMLIGIIGVKSMQIDPDVLNLDELEKLNTQFLENFRQLGFFTVGGVVAIWLHNLRAVAIASVAGVFTFGVLGVLFLVLPLSLISFLAGAASLGGINPLTFMVAFTMPHGIFEIPAMILSGAAILQIGATMLTPAKGQTIGEAFLRALADWFRVALALIAPLFLAASFLEVFLSPQVAVMLLGGS
ncbi:MAG: stage II sporulation protein M [Anaerolineales bacterium]|nr:stage II sporulation protein M [Anaerolineales bacterium]